MKCSKCLKRDMVCRLILSTHPNVIWVLCKTCKDKIVRECGYTTLPEYYRCQETVNGMPCGCYAFNTYRTFIVRPDGKLIPEERQICANPRCQKPFFVDYDNDTVYTIH